MSRTAQAFRQPCWAHYYLPANYRLIVNHSYRKVLKKAVNQIRPFLTQSETTTCVMWQLMLVQNMFNVLGVCRPARVHIAAHASQATNACDRNKHTHSRAHTHTILYTCHVELAVFVAKSRVAVCTLVVKTMLTYTSSARICFGDVCVCWRIFIRTRRALKKYTLP